MLAQEYHLALAQVDQTGTCMTYQWKMAIFSITIIIQCLSASFAFAKCLLGGKVPSRSQNNFLELTS